MNSDSGIRPDSSDVPPASRAGPTVKPPGSPTLASALERNIDALVQRRVAEEHRATLQQRIADRITRVAGSMVFVYLHVALFGGWIVLNVGWLPAIQPWDASLVILAMVASVEAIFLSTFVMISQNRMAAEDNKRADLNLQISLLNEHETTRLLTLVAAVAEKVGATSEVDGEIRELEDDVAPEAVLDRLEAENAR